jgi:transposase-like protein
VVKACHQFSGTARVIDYFISDPAQANYRFGGDVQVDEIAARLDTPRQVVSKWRKRFYDERLAGLTDLPRGASASTPPHHRRRAARCVWSTNTPAAARWPT